MKHTLTVLLLLFSAFSQATVVLVYHHVSDKTPKSTSISPNQFKLHLQYFKDQDFKVIPLNELVSNLKTKQPLADKTLVITFDDGYSDILANAHPLLQDFNYPYTVFINPSMVPKKAGYFLDWQQLKQMSADGVLIANHGLMHDSLIKNPLGVKPQQWLNEKLEQLQQAEQIIKQQLGQNWQYFALPYGEYSRPAQFKLQQMGYTVFTQQSGPVGLSTELTAIPRFPASMPYDKLTPLKDKLNSLAFTIAPETQHSATVVNGQLPVDSQIKLEVKDFYPGMLSCYVEGLGSVKLDWQKDQSFRMNLDGEFKPGRVRANCTAPSIAKPGRYYWYSKAWFVPYQDGSWYKY